MRLLMLPRYDALGASSRLRTLQYVPLLQAQGVAITVTPLLGDGYVSDLYSGKVAATKVARSYLRRFGRLVSARGFDAIWVEKEFWPWLPGWLEHIPVPRQPALIADYDDAVFHRYDNHRSSLVRSLLGSKIDTVMRRADLVTAGNDYLAERARSSGGKRVAWLPTVVDLDRYVMKPTARDPGTVTIGWIGSPSTAEYLLPLAPVMETLARRHRIRCVAIGARPDQVQGTPFEAWEWREDTEAALLRELDIGVMPLPDAPWERGKCGYKLIQYMACGLPVVASPVGVNTTIVQPGLNGALAVSTDEWVEALERMVEEPRLRDELGKAGRRQVEQVYSLQAQAPRLLGMLRETVAGKRP
ncbi:glycosyltransferase family 4 protein [Luteimonas qiangzhengi]|uniref:glycosyltransferase family 4 protein n=1 Tax=Luteimonas sp. MJ146 TaxID=3129240 RepID=UPI0031BA0C62